MGKSAPKPPPVPDPTVTAQAQTASNVATAQTNAALNRVNQYTPQGSLVYTQTNPADPNSWTATQTYSPAEQNLFNLSTTAQGLYGNTALNQLGTASQSLSQPINTNYGDVRNQYIQSQMGLIQPQLQQQQQLLQSQLANQGVSQGSTAWNNAMRAQNNLTSQTYANVLANAGNTVGQSIQQQESLRDQPLNEAAALLTGQQVASPQFTSVPQSEVSPTNVLGAYGMAQNQAEANYQAQMANYSSMLGGIGGLAGTALGAGLYGGSGGFGSSLIGSIFSSDRRLKTDIRDVGSLKLATGDLPIHTFRFKGDPIRRLGLIAQEVEQHDPGAVYTHPITGMKGVNYGRVLLGAHHASMHGQRRAA